MDSLIANKCDVCGAYAFTYEKKYLSRYSMTDKERYYYCAICYNMKAEPLSVLMTASKQVNGRVEDLEEKFPFIFYSSKEDEYVDIKTKKTLPIKFIDGTEVFKKQEALRRLLI